MASREELAAFRAALAPQVKARYLAGAPIREIRQEFGISHGLTLRVLEEAGVERRHGGWDNGPQVRAAFAAMSPERKADISRRKSEGQRNMDPATKAARSAKIAAAKRGKPRPDLAERNKTEAMRSIPREITPEGRRKISEFHTTHGHSRNRSGGRGASKTYWIWAAMIQRCTNPNDKGWKYYGGRGISVCERWRDFRNFLADMGEKPDGLSIDRINNDGNYEPGNCRWATASEQQRNKRPKGSVT